MGSRSKFSPDIIEAIIIASILVLCAPQFFVELLVLFWSWFSNLHEKWYTLFTGLMAVGAAWWTIREQNKNFQRQIYFNLHENVFRRHIDELRRTVKIMSILDAVLSFRELPEVLPSGNVQHILLHFEELEAEVQEYISENILFYDDKAYLYHAIKELKEKLLIVPARYNEFFRKALHLRGFFYKKFLNSDKKARSFLLKVK